MAYNNTKNPLDATGLSIQTQVAFKAAVDLVAAGKMDVIDLPDLTGQFADILVAEVTKQIGANTSHPATQAAPSTQSRMEDEFGATEVGSGDIVVLNKEGPDGPIPAWAVAQFKAAGVTKVFDNRATKTGNQPWFKTPKDAEKYGEPNDKAFWPPRN